MHELREYRGVLHLMLRDDGVFPNSERYPLLLYRSISEMGDAVSILAEVSASSIELLFQANEWGGSWRNGIYGMHHYHSTAHEVLGVYSGSATVQLGGEEGVILDITAGDVVVIPAGVAHKRLSSTGPFSVVGAYPAGQSPDMNYGRAGERPGTDGKIRKVSRPSYDPVLGPQGPLLDLWPV